MHQDKLYYDGQCPLCSAEMRTLKQHAEGNIDLIDIHDKNQRVQFANKETLLTLLHLEQADGTVLTGLDANVAAWQHTPAGVLFRWLRWPLIKPVADVIYGRWAERRYRRLYKTKD